MTAVLPAKDSAQRSIVKADKTVAVDVEKEGGWEGAHAGTEADWDVASAHNIFDLAHCARDGAKFRTRFSALLKFA